MAEKAKKSGRKRRKMTVERLNNIALYYCQRYLVSERKLSDHLKNRVYRDTEDGEDRRKILEEIPVIAARMARAGLVNDREAASARLRSNLRSGYAPGAAAGLAAMAARVERETVEDVLPEAMTDTFPDITEEPGEDAPDGAALALAALERGRRGPFRGDKRTEKTDQRDVAWLQRRGYRFDDIRKAMNVDGEEYFDG